MPMKKIEKSEFAMLYQMVSHRIINLDDRIADLQEDVSFTEGSTTQRLFNDDLVTALKERNALTDLSEKLFARM